MTTTTPAATPLKKRALSASGWLAIGIGTQHVIRLGSNLVLTRLLFPEAFGLMALVQVFLNGLNMFSDIGIMPSIVQSKRGTDPDFLNTAWTMQLVRGFVLWFITCIGAWPFARLFGEPQLMWLIPATGATAAIAGFSSTVLATAGRDLELGRLTRLDIVSRVLGTCVMIGCALTWRSVWALVVGSLASSLTKMLLSNFWLADCTNRLHWDKSAARELMTFGRWIFVSTAVTFVASQTDRLLLGKLVSIEMLGVYSLGVMLAATPKLFVDRLAAGVLFPALSDYARRNRSQLRAKVIETRELIIPTIIVLVLGIILFAPPFFRYLYDARYHDAGWMAQLIAISTWLSALAASSRRALIAIGRSGPQAAANTADAIMTVVGCVVGFAWFGIVGLILGYAIGSLAKLLVIHVELARSQINIVRQDLKFTILLLTFLFVGGLNWMALLEGGSILQGGLGAFIPGAAVSFAACCVWATRTVCKSLVDRRSSRRQFNVVNHSRPIH